jgi:exodeoxyribonuclease V gamma subunit
MPGLNVYSGNRLETLALEFSRIIGESPLPPMTGEIVIVQSTGMMKWLSMELAGHLGIWANCRYLFPNPAAGEIMELFFPGSGDERFFDKDIMTFKIMDILSGSSGAGLSPDIGDYISGDSSGLKLFQISSKISDTFDQYITFRPEMILDWDRGDFVKDEWQPNLWKKLTGSIERLNPPALMEKLFNSLKDPGFTPAVPLPERITVFGISYIPLYHINILRAASLFSTVNIFVLNPSSRYWGDILKEKEKTGIIVRAPVKALDPEELHLETGNTLLASMGRVGRDFLHYIFSSDIDINEDFHEPSGENLLNMIQGDIFTLTDRGGETPDSFHRFTEVEVKNDNSLLINSCHSGIRELEVLRDYILDLFNNDSSLEPGDILVMTPDIENYSDYIQAVFEEKNENIVRIPYSIADRKAGSLSPDVDDFLRILDLGTGRFTATEIFSFLENEHIRARFKLDAEEVEKLVRWADDTRVYWGVNGKWKESLGLPSQDENTWQAGIGRMITGFLVQNRGDLCMDVLPYEGVEGGDAILLGRFITFFKSLVKASDIMKKRMTLESWSISIMEIMETLFEDKGDIPEELFPVADSLDKMKSTGIGSGYVGEISTAVVRSWLEKTVSGKSSARNFVNGKVTFCEMLPMRSIPFRVICLIGMNSSLFPRKSRAPGFDLIAANPKRGDRSVREEDRYLFLETLISARDKLYISYTGQNVRTNEEMNPSIVVSELMDYIEQGYGIEGGNKKIRDFIFKKQRLQPFNPVYFAGNEYYSYNEEAFKNAVLSLSRERDDVPFFNTALSDIIMERDRIDADDFIEFFVNPSRALLSARLGIGLDPGELTLRDEEPFVPGGLDRYVVDTALLKAIEAGRDMDEYYKILCSAGILPHGTPGSVLYSDSLNEQSYFYSRIKPYLMEKDDTEHIIVEAGGLKISGTVKSLYGGRSIFYRCSGIKTRDMLRAWIYHLLLSASGKKEYETVLFGRDERVNINSLTQAQAFEYLEVLAGLFRKGMMEPLEVFERSTFAYAEEFYTASSEPGQRAMKKALPAFHGSKYIRGDIEDFYVNKLFAGYSPERKFAGKAILVYGPVYENMERIK